MLCGGRIAVNITDIASVMSGLTLPPDKLRDATILSNVQISAIANVFTAPSRGHPSTDILLDVSDRSCSRDHDDIP